MTLIKLQLNIADQDLAYRFGINQSVVSRCIMKWLDLLYVKLALLILWPDRDQSVKTMPVRFRKNFKIALSLSIEKPTSHLSRAQTWSNYKNTIRLNTCKFLIRIAPQGSVAFISKGWGEGLWCAFDWKLWSTEQTVTRWCHLSRPWIYHWAGCRNVLCWSENTVI